MVFCWQEEKDRKHAAGMQADLDNANLKIAEQVACKIYLLLFISLIFIFHFKREREKIHIYI